MAIACANTIIKHLNDTNREVDYYDLILTGDLGIYGIEIVKRVLHEEKKIKLKNVIDSGSIFYGDENIYAGSSGPVCLPLILFDYIIKQNKYKKILIILIIYIISLKNIKLKQYMMLQLVINN